MTSSNNAIGDQDQVGKHGQGQVSKRDQGVFALEVGCECSMEDVVK